MDVVETADDEDGGHDYLRLTGVLPVRMYGGLPPIVVPVTDPRFVGFAMGTGL
jgi:hypothetical protein